MARTHCLIESAKFCLERAGITSGDVDIVTIPLRLQPFLGKARWHYCKRYCIADRSLDAILMGNVAFSSLSQKEPLVPGAALF